ncbi:MAG: DUF3696 domain-containing protein [Deltaproteobacteria bacterium]|nr:DUF3696 domain-containing protein [Deltaproteobacteria bacterium]
MNIIMENVRSFIGRHNIRLRPLTFLVGENSTGKSTLLAGIAAIKHPRFLTTRPPFNLPPFDWGGYESIASYRGGKYGRAKSFSVGYTHLTSNRNEKVVATFFGENGQARLSEVMFESVNGAVKVETTDEQHGVRVTALNSVGEVVFTTGSPFYREWEDDLSVLWISIFLMQKKLDEEKSIPALGRIDPLIDVRTLEGLVSSLNDNVLRGGKVISLAPIRSQPKRTYDQLSDDFNPEGDHIPTYLSRIFREAGQNKDVLIKILEPFGQESGLFRQIGVKSLGKGLGDPFQIMVKVDGQAFNLVDVGYGVCQSLPLVVQSIVMKDARLMLLQQPEVHLHPRAQAALGSFFARLVAEGQKEFVIETHSDYIVDRVRQEVAKGMIKPDDVAILYFEKKGVETKVHPIRLDEYGNILNAPTGYRDFFLREKTELLQRTSR